jgi:chromosome segregation ATPase
VSELSEESLEMLSKIGMHYCEYTKIGNLAQKLVYELDEANKRIKELEEIPPFSLNEIRQITVLQEKIDWLEHENKLLKAKSKTGILEGYIDKIKELESELAKWKKYECEISNKHSELRDSYVELEERNDKLEEDIREKLEEMLPVYQRAGTIDYLLSQIKARISSPSKVRFIKTAITEACNYGTTIMTLNAEFEYKSRKYVFITNGLTIRQALDKLLMEIAKKMTDPIGE